MPSQWKKVGFAVVALLMLPAMLAAQEVPAGKWTGTITPPNGTTVQATFDVTVAGDSIAITLNGPFGSLPSSEGRIHPDRLTFTFSPGTRVECTLMLQEDRSYKGECLDSDGDPGIIVMVPPAAVPDGTASGGRR